MSYLEINLMQKYGGEALKLFNSSRSHCKKAVEAARRSDCGTAISHFIGAREEYGAAMSFTQVALDMGEQFFGSTEAQDLDRDSLELFQDLRSAESKANIVASLTLQELQKLCAWMPAVETTEDRGPMHGWGR